jgi:hypothetical protein
MRLEMRRVAMHFATRRWPPWVLVGAICAFSVADATLSTLDEDWARYSISDQPAAFKQFENQSHGMPASGRQSATNVSRRSSPRMSDPEQGSSFLRGQVWDLLHQPRVNPGLGSRLDFCSEFTKPDSLKIRLMGTPKNHRSPPA